jgi:hypothetical protein
MSFGVLMALVRSQLYVPDGKCPQKIRGPRPWSEKRDASILKQLCRRYGESDVRAAIYGLAILRDAGELNWARPRSKMTLRCIYNTSCGVEDVFQMARYTYIRSLNNRSRSAPSLGKLLHGDGM